MVTNYDTEGAYIVSPEAVPLVNGPMLWVKKAIIAIALAAVALLNPSFDMSKCRSAVASVNNGVVLNEVIVNMVI